MRSFLLTNLNFGFQNLGFGFFFLVMLCAFNVISFCVFHLFCYNTVPGINHTISFFMSTMSFEVKFETFR